METKILSQSNFKYSLVSYGVQLKAMSQCPDSKDIRDEAERQCARLLDHDQAQRDRIAALEAERDEARHAVAALHAEKTTLITELHDRAVYSETQTAEIGFLRQRLEEAGKDTARLDWLEQNSGELAGEMIEVDPKDEDSETIDGWGVYGAVKMGERRQVVSATGETLRIAIDAAIEAAGEKANES